MLRQWGNIEKAPAGAGTAAAAGKYIEKAPAGAGPAAAVGKYSYDSCGSGHCCGSEEIRILMERELLGWLMWR